MFTYKLICFLVLGCAIIFALLPSANSIQCFECNSNTDKNCSLKIPPDYLKRNCSNNNIEKLNYSMCRKITQTIDFEVNGLKPDSRIIRSCAYEPHQDTSKECYQRSGFGGRQEVCTCTSDLCNNSNNLKLNYAVVLPSTFVIYVFSCLIS